MKQLYSIDIDISLCDSDLWFEESPIDPEEYLLGNNVLLKTANIDGEPAIDFIKNVATKNLQSLADSPLIKKEHVEQLENKVFSDFELNPKLGATILGVEWKAVYDTLSINNYLNIMITVKPVKVFEVVE